MGVTGLYDVWDSILECISEQHYHQNTQKLVYLEQ